MSLSPDRFAQGMTYEEYIASLARNRERFEANERELALSEGDLAPFRALERPLKVLVLSEDWCGDCVTNVPILGRIAKETGKLDIRVFRRDENDDLMGLYLNKGQYRSIPVFAFFEPDFREVGRFTERPDSVTELRARRRAEILARHGLATDVPASELPEDVREEIVRMRSETKLFADREVVGQLRGIVSRVRVPTSS